MLDRVKVLLYFGHVDVSVGAGSLEELFDSLVFFKQELILVVYVDSFVGNLKILE